MSRSTFVFLVLLLVGPGNGTLIAEEGSAPAPGEDTRRAIILLMRENRTKYGDDATIMQGLLLVHANQSGAILATESAIVGFEERNALRYVTFRVDSGQIFADDTSAEDRLAYVWRTILERTLRRYTTFTAPADGIAIEIQYSHRAFESVSELYQAVDETGVVEKAKFYLGNDDLAGFLEQRLGVQQFLDRSGVYLDGTRVHPTIGDFVGPPEPGGPFPGTPFH